jgi:hypothetical protein
VTGTLAELPRLARTPAEPLPRSSPELFLGDDRVDLVASVNLLSQLPCMPDRFLRQAGVRSWDEIDAYARHLIEAHLDYLARLPGTVALIADTECITVGSAARVVHQHSTIYGAAVPWAGETWTWQFLPRRAAYPHHGYQRLVVGIPDVKQAPPSS